MEKIINLIKQKKILLIMLLIMVTVTMVSLLLMPRVEDNVIMDDRVYHKEEGIIKEEKYSGIKFSDISMVTDNGYTTFTATVTNESENDITNERLSINLLDKNGSSLIKLLCYIPDGLKKGESKTINASAKGEFKEAFSKKIEDYSIEVNE